MSTPTARAPAAGSARGRAGRIRGRSDGAAMFSSTRSSGRFRGTSRSTGPGRPLRATRRAMSRYSPRPAALGGEHDGGLVSLVNQADVALLQGAEERLQVAGKAEDGLDALPFDCSCHQLRTQHALPPPGHWAARRRAQPNAVAAAAEGPKRPLREG